MPEYSFESISLQAKIKQDVKRIVVAFKLHLTTNNHDPMKHLRDVRDMHWMHVFIITTRAKKTGHTDAENFKCS